MRRIAKQLVLSVGLHALVLVGILAFLAYPKPFASVAPDAIVVDVVTPDQAPPEKPEKQQPETARQDTAQQEQTPPEPAKPAREASQSPAAQPAQAQATPAQGSREIKLSPAEVAQMFATYNFKIPEIVFDAKAAHEADLTRDQITAFKTRLKSCWRPQQGLSEASRTHVVLRIALRPDGSLAGEPSLVEASAAADGPSVMRTAMSAVSQCAPFTFLPADKYKEWQVMDVRFTAREMAGG
jgi:hypothetical protein